MSSLPWKPPAPPVQLAGVSDLTVLTPMRQGLIPGVWDTLTWAERFGRVLALLDALRKLSREASPMESPFFDLVGRWQIVHFFRFAAVSPERTGGGAPQILLNVTFDGVWEPYMRVIWGPLGPLLDLIFSHAQTYRLAHDVGFDDYMAWVRANEVRPGFFYADGGVQAGDLTATVHDRSWLVGAEHSRNTAQVLPGQAAHLDARALLVPPPKQRLMALAAGGDAERKRLRLALATGLRVVRAFHSLRLLFGSGAAGESTPLLRAAHALLEEFHDFVGAGGFDALGMADLKALHRDPLEWFGQPVRPAQRPRRDPPLAVPDPAGLQSGLLEPHGGGHGLLLLARVRLRRAGEDTLPIDLLRAKLATWGPHAPVAAEDPEPPVSWNIGFTPQGLAALGLPAGELDRRFPLDFRQGMEARAPAMGDLGGNHPQQWKRPRRNWSQIAAGGVPEQDDAKAERIDLSEVQMAIQLRTVLDKGEAEPARGTALPRLVRVAAALDAIGLEILSAQPLQRRLGTVNGQPVSVGHFEFADPVSQPRPGAGDGDARYWSDAVPWGEVLLGHDNKRRGDEAWPDLADPLLDNGSYWVVRKLRQYRKRWVEKVPALADREAMVGRRADGRPLLATGPSGANDFRFDAVKDASGAVIHPGDPHGNACPFASHVRRVNPRTDPLPGQAFAPGQAGVPRLLRRGLSYGPGWAEQQDDEVDRGLVFMAFNARIADQFETLQRWLSGGNASGVPSSHDDPLCGMPRLGRERGFAWVDGTGAVQRRPLGNQAFVEVQWGLYLFVPSLAGLQALADTGAPASAATRASALPYARPGAVPMPLPSPQAPLEVWKELLETGPAERRHAVWASVRAAGGVLATQHAGALVGSQAAVLEVLRDRGERFSVAGYGERMERSIGLGYLGQDGAEHDRLANRVNPEIESLPASAVYTPVRAAVAAGLAALKPAPDSGLVPVDLVALLESAIGGVCAQLFGLPDGLAMGGPPGVVGAVPAELAHCPRDQPLAARGIFLPHPDKMAEDVGQHAGQRIRMAGLKHVQALRLPGAQPRPLAAKVLAAVEDAHAGETQQERDRIAAQTLVGILQGLPATVLGHGAKLLVGWGEDGRLWEIQRELLALPVAGRDDAAQVGALLLPRLMAQMPLDPVPDLLWRTAAQDTVLAGVRIARGQKLVLSLRSAAADAAGATDAASRWALAFGNSPPSAGSPTFHGCPGAAIAEGLLMGLLVAMAEAGSWQRSGSPTLLMLRR